MASLAKHCHGTRLLIALFAIVVFGVVYHCIWATKDLAKLVHFDQPVGEDALAKFFAPAVAAQRRVPGEIPKIIHVMFRFRPVDYGRYAWPNTVWKYCYKAWQRYFPEPEYIHYFWTDELIDDYFSQKCRGHAHIYFSGNVTISRSDLARYCILMTLGGIYSDLDYEPRRNFYSELKPGKVNLVESPYYGEMVQNALMASPVGEPAQSYWEKILNATDARQEIIDPTTRFGPGLLSAVSETRNTSFVHLLPCKRFQLKVHHEVLSPLTRQRCGQLSRANLGTVYGIHWGTWSWYALGKGKNTNDDTKRLFKKLHDGDLNWWEQWLI